MAEQLVLEATKRDVTGKEVRHLRAEGIIPAVVYGPSFDPMQIQVAWTELRTTLLEAGGSQIITLNVDGEKYNALVRDVQRTAVRNDVLHVDFYRVRMDVAIRTDVPVVVDGDMNKLEGESGIIVHEMTSITVECLPGDLPQEVVISLDGINEVGDTLTVENLPELEGVSFLAEPTDVVVSSSYMRVAEAEEGEDELGEDGTEPELIRREDEDEDES